MKCKDIRLIGQVLLFQLFNSYIQKMAVITTAILIYCVYNNGLVNREFFHGTFSINQNKHIVHSSSKVADRKILLDVSV